jgi:CXXC-20-CXXC protein
MKCDNCNTEFKYSSLLKSFWSGYANIKCEQCDAVFEHKTFNRLVGGLIIGVSLVASTVIVQDSSILKTAIGFIVIAGLLLLLNPLIMKFNRVK